VTGTPRLRALLICLGVVLGTGVSGAASSAQAARQQVSVGMVLVAPSVGRDYVSSPVAGLERAVRQFRIKGLALTPTVREGFAPSLTSLANEGYDLIMGIGFEEGADMVQVARRFPHTRFALIDTSVSQLGPHSPKNVLGLVFREQQVGYLAGYLAALKEDLRHRPHVVSTVGGVADVPAVQRYIAGFQAGARKADPQIRLLNDYSNDFDNADICKGLARAQIAKGSGVVFQVAGGCGLGALEAAGASHVFGIGVDSNQSYLGRYILTSALKRWDRAVFQAIRELQAGSLPRSGDIVFGYRSGDMGLAPISRVVPRSIVQRIEALERAMAAGRIRNIPTCPPWSEADAHYCTQTQTSP
jgi:basic membrane protein A